MQSRQISGMFSFPIHIRGEGCNKDFLKLGFFFGSKKNKVKHKKIKHKKGLQILQSKVKSYSHYSM